jgi:hypothetical protein
MTIETLLLVLGLVLGVSALVIAFRSAHVRVETDRDWLQFLRAPRLPHVAGCSRM